MIECEVNHIWRKHDKNRLGYNNIERCCKCNLKRKIPAEGIIRQFAARFEDIDSSMIRMILLIQQVQELHPEMTLEDFRNDLLKACKDE